MEYEHFSAGNWIIILAIAAVGGGLYIWHWEQVDILHKDMYEFPPQHKERNDEIEVLSNVDEIAKVLPKTKVTAPFELSSYCTDSPTGTAIGRYVYPIDQKYGNLRFLGELFTANNCGPERTSKIFGVEGKKYTLGSALGLKSNPSPSLIITLTSIGYQCSEEGVAAHCKQWELQDVVSVDELMRLEPYYQNFRGNDCRKCG